MKIAVVCVPYSYDITRWGSARSPEAYIGRGLLDRLRERGHIVAEPVTVGFTNAERSRDTVANLALIARRQADAVAAALREPDTVAMVLGGNCAHAPGTPGGVVRARGSCGVAWFDAHGDMATWETTTSGMLGGMAYAVILGWTLQDWREGAGVTPAVRPEAAALIGTSDLDPGEVEALGRHPLAHLTAHDISGDDVEAVMERTLAPRASAAPAWYLHMDLDVAGPAAAPGARVPAPNWPPRDKLLRAVAQAARTLNVVAFTPGATNPAGDPGGLALDLGIETALTIADALASSRR